MNAADIKAVREQAYKNLAGVDARIAAGAKMLRYSGATIQIQDGELTLRLIDASKRGKSIIRDVYMLNGKVVAKANLPR